MIINPSEHVIGDGIGSGLQRKFKVRTFRFFEIRPRVRRKEYLYHHITHSYRTK